MITLKFTRRDYMANKVDYKDYMSQFVTAHEIGRVKHLFGDRINNSTDEHFNDIPLRQWDSAAGFALSEESTYAMGRSNATTTQGGIRTISLGDKVAILKAAARQIRGW